MSRTYRLRHEHSRVAHKFGDGRYSVHMDTIDSDLSAIIVHGIYGYPCRLAEPIYYVKHTFGDISCVSHHTVCLSLLITSWKMTADVLNKFAGDKRYSIASIGYHRYAYPKCSIHKKFKWYARKGIRLACNTTVRTALKLDNFDEDWDAKLYYRKFCWS